MSGPNDQSPSINRLALIVANELGYTKGSKSVHYELFKKVAKKILDEFESNREFYNKREAK